MTGRKKHEDYSHQPRRDRMDEERVSDPYRTRGKWPEPTTCPECGAIVHHGQWRWGKAAPEAEQHLCPACQRIHDRVPAGQLTLSYPDGKTSVVDGKVGQVMWIPAESHAAVNTGSTEFTALVVELKPLPAYDEGE